MPANWDYVKKTTLWQYEELINKLQKTLAYPVIRQHYNHSMAQASEYARRLFSGKDLDAPQNGDFHNGVYPGPLLPVFWQLEISGIANWAGLIGQIGSREKLLIFLEVHNLSFEQIIDVLCYLLRWGLPFDTATRELLDHDDPQEMVYYEALKKCKIASSFDLLERGHSPAGRERLCESTGLPEDFITSILHRADIARLPFVRRKTILILCGAGYDTLKKIASADPSQIQTDLDDYLRRAKASSYDNYKAVILIQGLITGARALPTVVVT